MKPVETVNQNEALMRTYCELAKQTERLSLSSKDEEITETTNQLQDLQSKIDALVKSRSEFILQFAEVRKELPSLISRCTNIGSIKNYFQLLNKVGPLGSRSDNAEIAQIK